jgi:hypothetical protein
MWTRGRHIDGGADQTTMYADGEERTSEVSETLTVQVQRADVRVLRFMALTNISAGKRQR